MRIAKQIYKTWTTKILQETLKDYQSRIKDYRKGEYNNAFYRFNRIANDIKQELLTR